MTLEEFYSKLGGNHDDVLSRLLSEKRIEHFVFRFLDDNSMDTLCTALKDKNYNQAFHSAHNLKGLAQNLGFIRLASSAGNISEVLRSENETIREKAYSLIGKVTADHNEVRFAIEALQESL